MIAQGAIALLTAALLPAAAHGATITVTTEDDLLAAGGPCSLREAIQAANTDAVSGGCTAGSGADTINLPAGSFGLSRSGASENANSTGDLDITAGTVTIAGGGAGLTTIDARGIDRVLHVLVGATATLTNLTVFGGRAPDGVDGATAAHGAAGVFPGGAGGASNAGNGNPGEPGGGLLNAGTLALDGVTVTGNRAGRGGDGGDSLGGGDGAASNVGAGGAGGNSIAGVGALGGSGGGIHATGPLTIANSTISDNSSGNGGAGGAATGGGDGGASTAANGAGGPGGLTGLGIGNSGGNGGGISSTGASLAISNSTIARNATGDGGDIAISGNGGDGGAGAGTGNGGGGGLSGLGISGLGGSGGGILHSGAGAVSITTSTISDNVTGHGGDTGATGDGGSGGTGGAGTGSGGSGSLSGLEITQGGGAGGGILTNDAEITRSTLSGNRTGRGGFGIAPGSGGAGGGSGGGGGTAGGGGTSGLGFYGSGGAGGNASLTGTVLMTNVTITGGSTGNGAPGVAGGPGPAASGGSIAGSGGNGGGVSASAQTTMINVTVSGNSTGAGGALGTAGTGASPIAPIGGVAGVGPGVRAGRLQSSIVAANGTTAGCAGTPVDLGGNLSFPDASCPGVVGDPRLGSLAPNGGPTRTRALLPGSGAIDLVAAAVCPTTDQRGVARPQGTGCEAGAYEIAPPVVTTGPTSALQTTKATLTGQVTPNARATTFHFEFGPTDAYGSSTPDASAGNGFVPAAAEAAIEGLKPGTTTHYRLVATNADGTTTGADQTLTTPAFGVGIETAETTLTASRTAPVMLACPAETLGGCAGELVLTARVKVKKRAAKKKTIVVGRAAFDIPAGSRAEVAVPVKKKAAKFVEKAKRKGLTSTATATATDDGANQGVTTAVLKIKRAKRV